MNINLKTIIWKLKGVDIKKYIEKLITIKEIQYIDIYLLKKSV